MVGFVAGLIASAAVKISSDKLCSALSEQAGLLWNFRKDLEDMKDTMESIAAVLKDAEKQSVKNESVRVWLKRLKHAALDISDMMDDYQDTTTQATAKMPFLKVALKKKALANKMKKMREKLEKINKERQSFNFVLAAGANLEQKHYDPRETTSTVDEKKILGRDGEKEKIIDILSANHRIRKDGAMVLPIYGLGGMGKSTMAQLVYNDTQFKQSRRKPRHI
ncbi:hypothetical protein QOZ80_7BG0583260 [Eleusine coracana subsp. coracana]|nr:hypothetical protein QOZ80_7BG0583260 [Eleusine coracana subsp. coracana]